MVNLVKPEQFASTINVDKMLNKPVVTEKKPAADPKSAGGKKDEGKKKK